MTLNLIPPQSVFVSDGVLSPCQCWINYESNLAKPLYHYVRIYIFSMHQRFHSQEWSKSIFSCCVNKSITKHSMKNLAFHTLFRWRMIVLPILYSLHHLVYISLKRLGRMYFLRRETTRGIKETDMPTLFYILHHTTVKPSKLSWPVPGSETVRL